jgi:beta-glucosidase
VSVTSHTQFPRDFKWGVATAAYQVEGAVDRDGRGESIWDRFVRTSGTIIDGQTGDTTCNSYELYKDDVSLLKLLNVRAYRFSIAWSRIVPDGIGSINQPGLDYYERLIDALLEANITPFVTLYHWDLPQCLQDRGGWENRDTAAAFADYAQVVVRRFGDRVEHWITHNEPWCTTFLGHYKGILAPGIRNLKTALQVSHHVLLSHGIAVSAMRAAVSKPLQIGIAPNMEPAVPASSTPEDSAAAQRYDGFFTRWFFDPLVGRSYPEDMWAYYGDCVPAIKQTDLKTISVPIDFVGVNYYNRYVAKHDPAADVPHTRNIPSPTRARTADREIFSEGLYTVLTRLHQDYGFKAIYVSENGAAYPDAPDEHGCIHDTYRIRFLQEHFAQAANAIKAGVPLKGYFVWTLMDNFEWMAGFTLRYGLAYTDFATGKRTLKSSGNWLNAYINATTME